jgi:hypothetical protein
LLALALLGVLIAGFVYAFVILRAVNERSHAPYVHTHSAH